MNSFKNCVYQLIYDKSDSDGTKIIQYFTMQWMGLIIKVDSHVAHMLYECPFSNNTSVQIAINNNKYLIYLNTNTTVFDWGPGNYNKNRT